MSDDGDARPDGPVEHFPFPSTLAARVVAPGPEPRVHGYDVQSDLVTRYSLAEQAVLALTGALPDRETGQAIEVALAFLSPASVAEAPAHTALLARLCGATTSATIAAAALALAEQARDLVAKHAAWLSSGEPGVGAARAPGVSEGLARLRDALPDRFAALDSLHDAPSVEAAALLVLRACGLEEPDRLEPMIVWARLPTAVAEALAVSPASFRDYPMDLPRFEYEENDE